MSYTMRLSLLAALAMLALVACDHRQPPPPAHSAASPPPLTAEEAAAKTRERARASRQLQLFTLSTSPELPAAIHRFAVETVTEDVGPAPPPSVRGRKPAPGALTSEQWNARVAAEEARFRDGVRSDLEFMRQADIQAQRAQAVAICEGRGQTAAAMYPSRGILGLDAVMAGADVRRACMNTFQRTGIMPAF